MGWHISRHHRSPYLDHVRVTKSQLLLRGGQQEIGHTCWWTVFSESRRNLFAVLKRQLRTLLEVSPTRGGLGTLAGVLLPVNVQVSSPCVASALPGGRAGGLPSWPSRGPVAVPPGLSEGRHRDASSVSSFSCFRSLSCNLCQSCLGLSTRRLGQEEGRENVPNSVVLKWGNFAPQGTLATPGDVFGCHSGGVAPVT